MITVASTSRAATARSAWRSPVSAVVFTVGLSIGLLLPLSASGVAPGAGTPAAPLPAPGPATTAGAAPAFDAGGAVHAYVAVVRNVRAAVDAHDGRAAAAFRGQLDRLATPPVTAAATSRLAALIEDLDAASSRHDGRALAGFRVQLVDLCAAPGFLARNPSCDAWTH